MATERGVPHRLRIPARPMTIWSSKSDTSQRSTPATSRGRLAKRWTSWRASRPSATVPAMTRPLDAPRSMAPNTAGLLTGSAEEGRGHAAVDRDQQPGGQGQISPGQGEDSGGHVLGHDLLAQKRSLRVEPPQVLLLHAIDRGPLGPPSAGEDARASDHRVGVHPV